MRKRLTIMGMLLLCVGILFGCGSNSSEKAEGGSTAVNKEDKDAKGDKKEADLGDFNIQLAGEIIEEDDTFIIEGTSNLLPGSRIIGELIVSDDEVFSDSSELVDDDGSFHIELDNHEYGEAEFVVRFDFEGVQDDQIKRHYGEKGQKLEGPFIYKHENFGDILKKAEVRVQFDPSESNDLALKAPEWVDLPSDYGDPRVWIEIDEHTEDGEFYYLHGTSNVLEGSAIEVKYGSNNDKTTVLPDGSFNFKVDYEYIEDEDFIVVFNPSGFQWNEIEEAYGSEGQKLVGDLVETNIYNNQQYIEKHIQWDGNNTSGDQEQEDEKDEK